MAPIRCGVYEARVPKPAEGWTALFVGLLLDSGGKSPYMFMTQVNIMPDVPPHAGPK